MKRKIAFLILFSLIFALSVWAQEDQVVTISPEKPKIGDELTVTYNPHAKAAALREATEITVEALVMRETERLLIETVMTKKGNLWTASFKLADEKAKLILFRFVSGEQKDDNGENVWDVLVYGTDGKPVRDAHLQRASLLQRSGFWDFKYQKDVAAAKAEIAEEKALYPDSWEATTMLWSALMREKPDDETKAKVKEELSQLYEAQKNNEEVVARLLYWFEQTGQKDKAEDIRKAAVGANPKGRIAADVRASEMSSILRGNDNSKKVELYEKFLNDFPPKDATVSKKTLASLCVEAKQYDKAIAVLESMSKPEGLMYWYITSNMIGERDRLVDLSPEQFEKVVVWAKKGIDILRNPDPASKPSFSTSKKWKEEEEGLLGMTLSTYAFGLFKLGRTQEAEKAYEESYTLTKGSNADINERVAECYLKNGKFEKAIEVSADCIRRGKSTDKMVEHYKAAYARVKGPNKGFDEALNEAKDFAENEMKKRIMKGRINKPAVDFNLKGLDGRFVRLSELKGKVVVVDFWATWCGPCKASFPYLQKVYEQYINNGKVAIFALDTWEHVTGKERQELVKKFMEENKYTFPVLFDEKFVEKYGVEGIPTKFIIDREGKIQFKSVGFGRGQDMIGEMTLEIDMLLSDDFYSSEK